MWNCGVRYVWNGFYLENFTFVPRDFFPLQGFVSNLFDPKRVIGGRVMLSKQVNDNVHKRTDTAEELIISFKFC